MMLLHGDNLIGVHLGRYLASLSGLKEAKKNQFQEIVEILCEAMAQGHSCSEVTQNEIKLLKQTSLVSAGDTTPLVLRENRLYLHRYFSYEKKLANRVKKLARTECDLLVAEFLGDMFPPQDEPDLQRCAAELAVRKQLCLISGGPGTGKTSTVVKILGLLVKIHGRGYTIALAAPTGKAAMRLQESILEGVGKLSISSDLQKIIPDESYTLHRLLGYRRNSIKFKHNRDNPLRFDVVIIDEASMIDLALMSKLVDALDEKTKLILLGDRDQLASVESGAVLADLMESLPENTIILEKTYRFDEAIKRLAHAVNMNNSDEAWQILQEKKYTHLRVKEEIQPSWLLEGYSAYFQKIKGSSVEHLEEVFSSFFSFQILCATRKGRNGADIINARIDLAMKEFLEESGEWYNGRPVLITKNDYSMKLFNGDMGICMVDPEDGLYKIWFEFDGGVRPILPYRLPEYHCGYAMTIHKSQGSEFGEVVIVLPEEDNAVLSRELVYTAITRAKKGVRMLCKREVLELALSRKTRRNSGLPGLLREAF